MPTKQTVRFTTRESYEAYVAAKAAYDRAVTANDKAFKAWDEAPSGRADHLAGKMLGTAARVEEARERLNRAIAAGQQVA